MNTKFKFVIVANGKYGDIYYTGNKEHYWTNNITCAKFYDSYSSCKNKATDFVYNNPRVATVTRKVN